MTVVNKVNSNGTIDWNMPIKRFKEKNIFFICLPNMIFQLPRQYLNWILIQYWQLFNNSLEFRNDLYYENIWYNSLTKNNSMVPWCVIACSMQHVAVGETARFHYESFMPFYLAFLVNFTTCISDDNILSGEYDRAWDVESSEFLCYWDSYPR